MRPGLRHVQGHAAPPVRATAGVRECWTPWMTGLDLGSLGWIQDLCASAHSDPKEECWHMA